MTYWLVTAAATTLSRSAGSTTPGEPLRHVSRSDARIELSDIVLPIRAVEARQPLRCRETDRSSAGSVAKSPLVPRAPRLGMRLYGSGRPDRSARGPEAVTAAPRGHLRTASRSPPMSTTATRTNAWQTREIG